MLFKRLGCVCPFSPALPAELRDVNTTYFYRKVKPMPDFLFLGRPALSPFFGVLPPVAVCRIHSGKLYKRGVAAPSAALAPPPKGGYERAGAPARGTGSILPRRGRNMQEVNQDRRFAQANKEALLSLGVYALYFVWW